MFFNGRSGPSNQYGDSGSASRYFFRADLLPIEQDELNLPIHVKVFYCSKPSKYERSLGKETDDSHETVKPVALMHHLVTLITPPNGICSHSDQPNQELEALQAVCRGKKGGNTKP